MERVKKKPLHWLAICVITVASLYLIGQQTFCQRFTPGSNRRRNSSTHGNGPETDLERLPQNASRPEPRALLRSLKGISQPVLVVVVASSPRSGSTFFGELLASPREAVHFFEPFWYCDTHGLAITKDMHLTPEKSHHGLVKRYLLNMLKCSLTSLPPMFDDRLDLEIWRKPLLSHATVHQRKKVCLDLKMRLVKVVRPGLGSVLPLLQESDLDIHVLHLVRDPRAIVNSVRMKDDWISGMPPSTICSNIREDLKAAHLFNQSDLIEQRYTLVRYEDLVDRPEVEARRLFRRMGLELSEDVLHFIFTHSRQNFTSPAILRPETTLQPLTVHYRGASTIRRKSTLRPLKKQYSGLREWRAAKHNIATPEEVVVTEAVIHPDVQNYFGTIRDASFDGLRWLKDLPMDERREVELICKDVLEELGYPLVYPEERKREGHGE